MYRAYHNNMVWIIISAVFAVIFITLYSCLVAAKRADRAMKRVISTKK